MLKISIKLMKCKRKRIRGDRLIKLHRKENKLEYVFITGKLKNYKESFLSLEQFISH